MLVLWFGVCGGGQGTIKNCYNSGTYSSFSGAGYYSASLGAGANCSFDNCGSLNYGNNPGSYSNVTFTNVAWLTTTELKNAASVLGSNFKSASGSQNRGYPLLIWQ